MVQENCTDFNKQADLSEDHAITAKEIENTLSSQDISIEPGDILLLQFSVANVCMHPLSRNLLFLFHP
jgi:hypothetical protein